MVAAYFQDLDSPQSKVEVDLEADSRNHMVAAAVQHDLDSMCRILEVVLRVDVDSSQY